MDVKTAQSIALRLREQFGARTTVDVAKSGSTVLAEIEPGLRVQVFEQGGRIVLTPDHPQAVAHMEHNERLPKAKCLVDVESVVQTMAMFQNKLETFVVEMEKRAELAEVSELRLNANIALIEEESNSLIAKTRGNIMYGDGANWSCRMEVQQHLVQIDFTCSPVKAALFARWLSGI